MVIYTPKTSSLSTILFFNNEKPNTKTKQRPPRERNGMNRTRATFHSPHTLRYDEFQISKKRKNNVTEKKSEEQPFNWIIKIDTRSPDAAVRCARARVPRIKLLKSSFNSILLCQLYALELNVLLQLASENEINFFCVFVGLQGIVGIDAPVGSVVRYTRHIVRACNCAILYANCKISMKFSARNVHAVWAVVVSMRSCHANTCQNRRLHLRCEQILYSLRE